MDCSCPLLIYFGMHSSQCGFCKHYMTTCVSKVKIHCIFQRRSCYTDTRLLPTHGKCLETASFCASVYLISCFWHVRNPSELQRADAADCFLPCCFSLSRLHSWFIYLMKVLYCISRVVEETNSISVEQTATKHFICILQNKKKI